jgi:hypothetical protein
VFPVSAEEKGRLRLGDVTPPTRGGGGCAESPMGPAKRVLV